MSFLSQYDNDPRNEEARKAHPRAKRWVGARGGSSTRSYVCYLCGETIDTESARYGVTKHAMDAVASHDCGGCGNG